MAVVIDVLVRSSSSMRSELASVSSGSEDASVVTWAGEGVAGKLDTNVALVLSRCSSDFSVQEPALFSSDTDGSESVSKGAEGGSERDVAGEPMSANAGTGDGCDMDVDDADAVKTFLYNALICSGKSEACMWQCIM
jgi:hypothetical protein